MCLPPLARSVWYGRTASINDRNELLDGYFANVDTMLDAPTTNSISVRILYFIDYTSVVKQLRNRI